MPRTQRHTWDPESALAAAAYGLYRTVLQAALACAAGPYPNSQFTALLHQIEHPEPGDLVLEVSTALRGMNPARMGEFVRIERRRVDADSDEPWDEAVEEHPAPTEAIYVIRTKDGHEARWENARMIRVFRSESEFEKAIDTCDPPWM